MKKAIKKDNRGGARPGAGRKKVEDPVTRLTIFLRKSRLDKVGKPEAERVAVNAIERAYRQSK